MIIVAMRNHCNVHLIQINSQFLCIIRKNSAPPCIKKDSSHAHTVDPRLCFLYPNPFRR